MCVCVVCVCVCAWHTGPPLIGYMGFTLMLFKVIFVCVYWAMKVFCVCVCVCVGGAIRV